MKLHPSPITCFFIDEDNNLILVKSFNSTSCAITYEITLQNNKIYRFYKTFNNTMYKGVAHADVTTPTVNVIIMSRTTHFLKYTPWCTLHLWWSLTYFWSTFMNQSRYTDQLHFCITWQLLVLWLDSVPHIYEFILGKYTKSNGARSVEYGWWIARWNPNTSISSNVFLVVWHVALSWCNSTFAIRAEKSWSFFHNACMRRGKPSWTKQHNNSQMWRTSLIKVSNIQSNKSHTQIRCEGVLYCIFTNTSHPSNFLYGASLVTVDVVPRGIHYSAILILLPVTSYPCYPH